MGTRPLLALASIVDTSRAKRNTNVRTVQRSTHGTRAIGYGAWNKLSQQQQQQQQQWEYSALWPGDNRPTAAFTSEL